MPIYEYQCSKCGEIFEAFQRITDEPLAHCKYCRGRVEKLISHSSFQLKGGGWYLTDYARRNSGDSADKQDKQKQADAADSKTGKDSTGSEKSTESKT